MGDPGGANGPLGFAGEAQLVTSNSATLGAPEGSWPKSKFWLIAAFLFALQILALFMTGELPRGAKPKAAPPPVFQALVVPLDQDQIEKSFFVSGPACLFVRNATRLFRLRLADFRPASYAPVEELEPPSELALDAHRTEGRLSWAEGKNPIPFQLAEQKGAQLGGVPILTIAPVAPAQSRYRVEGPLAARQIGPPISLPSWPSAQLLINTVIEIGVNPAGEVIFHRFATRCGLPEADMEALSTARQLRFSPLGNAAPPVTWSRAVFEWQTLEPAAK